MSASDGSADESVDGESQRSPSSPTSPYTWPEGNDFLTLDFSPNKEIVHKWRKLPDCDEFVGARRSKHTSVAYKGAIFVFGGDNGKQMLNDLIRFDINDQSWGRAFTMGSLPAPRYHHTAVVHGSSMYVFGGYTGDIHSNSNLTNKNDLYEYKFSTGQWSEVRCEGKLPPARSAHGAAVFNDHLWIFGGFDGHTRLNDMWCLGLTSPIRRWQEVAQSGERPAACCNFAMALLEDSMFLFSGQSGAKTTNSLFRFHFASLTWFRITTEHILRAAAVPPHRRYGHTMVAHHKRLYVFGGAAESIHQSDLHFYDLETHTWSVIHVEQKVQKPSARLFHSAVVIGECMYIFGGTVDNNVRSSEMFGFKFSSYPRCTLHDDFGRLLESRQFCDLRFLVGKDKVPIFAHIAIVAARSQYLRGKIRQSRESAGAEEPADSVNNGNETAACGNGIPQSPSTSRFPEKCKDPSVLDVFIAGAEPFAFEMVLAYIYTDRIDPTQRGQEPMSNGVVMLMMEVYRLSLQFTMKRLEYLAVQYLESMIGLKNVLIALQSASRLGLNYIKEYCLRFTIKEGNFNHIVMSKEFETLEQPLMVEIIRRRQLPSIKPIPENLLPEFVDGPTLESDMRAFLETEVGADFCDITLYSNEFSVPVHKVVLAARSAYFEAMFRSWMPASNMVKVSLGDVMPSTTAFHSLLRYIYCGKTEMPAEDSLFLFAAPPFYGFSNNRLQIFCKENLETNIKTENVLDILEAADRIQANEMKRHALQIVVSNFSNVAGQEDKLSNLRKELLVDVIQAVANGVSSSPRNP